MVAAKHSVRSVKQESGQADRLGKVGILLAVYFFFEYVRPQSYHLIPALQPLRITMILSVILFIIFLKNEKSLLKDSLVRYTLLFILLIGLSVTYAPNTFSVWNTFKGMSIIFFCVIMVMPLAYQHSGQLRKLFNFWIFFHGLLALYGITHGGHGPGGFLWDENDLALALNMCIPLPFYMLHSGKCGKLQKLYLISVMLLLIIGSGSTMSRGGFLGLVSVFGMIWLLSESKLKSLSIVFLCVLLAGYPVYKLVPQDYRAEMTSIFSDSDSTRESRFEFWGYGWKMFLDNPVLGVGAQNYPWTVHTYQMREPGYSSDTVKLHGGRPAHSLYFTLIPELGLAGIIIFFLTVKQVFRRLRHVIALSRDHASMVELGLIAKALLVSTVAYLVTGAFISVLYYPPFWYIIPFVVTLDRVAGKDLKLIGVSEDNEAGSDTRNRNRRTWRRGNNPRPRGEWSSDRV